MVAPLRRHSWRKISHLVSSQMWTWKIVVITMLGNTEISRILTSMSPWTSPQRLKVWTKWISHLQSQKENWKDHEKGWLPIWLSRTKKCQRDAKRKGMPSEMIVRKNFHRIIGSLKHYLFIVKRVEILNMSLLTVTFIHQDSLRSEWWELMPSTQTITL